MNKELVILSRPKGYTAEAIRTLRTNLQFSLVDNKNVIMITSSIPYEGKSFISANLAAAFALNNYKVLLVDCDLRKGRQKSVFNIEEESGLSNLLIDNISSYKKYIHKTDIDNLSVMISGLVPPNPSELLNSDNCKNLFTKLREDYDIVIVDSAPVGAVSDSLVLLPNIDNVVITCTYKKTPFDALENTKKALINNGAKIAGVVINRVAYKKNKYNNEKYYE